MMMNDNVGRRSFILKIVLQSVTVINCTKNQQTSCFATLAYTTTEQDNWIGLCSVLRPRQHSIGYMGDGFYSSKDPTIKVLKEMLQRKKAKNENN